MYQDGVEYQAAVSSDFRLSAFVSVGLGRCSTAVCESIRFYSRQLTAERLLIMHLRIPVLLQINNSYL